MLAMLEYYLILILKQVRREQKSFGRPTLETLCVEFWFFQIETLANPIKAIYIIKFHRSWLFSGGRVSNMNPILV